MDGLWRLDRYAAHELKPWDVACGLGGLGVQVEVAMD